MNSYLTSGRWNESHFNMDDKLLLNKTQPRIVPLDGLRGIAILLVIIYHYSDQWYEHATRIDLPVVEFGRSLWFGVDIFFVLSGFLITGILLNTKTSPRYFTSFFGRRTVRIFPLYYLNILALCVILPKLHTAFQNEALIENQFWFWTYLANFHFAMEGEFGHTPGGYFWSVAVEEQFYIVWPFVVWLLGKKTLLRGIVGLLIASVTLRCLLLWSESITATAAYVLPFTHVDGLLLGALVAVIWRSPDMALPSASQLVCAASVGALGLAWIGRRGHLYFWERDVAAVGLLLIAIITSCALCGVLKPEKDSLAVRWLSHPFLLSFGKYSYAIYLAHVPIGRLVELAFKPNEHLVFGSLLPPLLAFILIGGAVSWFVSYLSWHFFEKHFLALKRYFPYDEPNS